MRPILFSSFFRISFGHVILFLTFSLSIIPAFADAFSTKTYYFPCTPTSDIKADQPQNNMVFTQQFQAFSEDMTIQHGFDQQNLLCLFNQVRHNNKVIELIKPPATSVRKNWQVYRSRVMTSSRIKSGIQFWQDHKAALNKAEKRYGIPPEIIVGIIGVETTYGRHKGHFRTLDTLTTLAFDYPEHPKREARVALFKKELEQFLLFCSEQHIDPLSLKGSYAGAIGWPQFLPSSIRKYAIDFDEDGHIDLRNSSVDAIGSIAHFLSKHGWKKEEPIIFPLEPFPECAFPPDTLLSKKLTAELTVEDLEKICVASKTPLPNHLLFGLIDLPNGENPTEYCLGTHNFFVITHYNRSFFYAMSVIELGRTVKILYEKNKKNADMVL